MTKLPGLGPPLIESGTVRVYPGYAFGICQPSALVTLRGAPMDDPVWKGLPLVWGQEARWRGITGQPGLPASWQNMPDNLVKVGLWLGYWTFRLQYAAVIPAFEPGRVLGMQQAPGQPSVLKLLLPMCPGRTAAVQKAFQIGVAMLNESLVAAQVGDKEDATIFEARLSAVRDDLRAVDQVEQHTWRFLRAAHEKRIPWHGLGGDIFRFGHGQVSRWLNVTLTDATAILSMRIAGNKDWASNVLRSAGLPVAPQVLVADVDLAVRLANRMGYPVVIKPADKDRGEGVTAGLSSEAEVRQAFERARSISPSILLEKHMPGRDYRLTVLNGRLIWAVERRPAGVVGDGVSTIQELIAHINSQRGHAEGPYVGLRQLVMDEEASQLLAKQGLGTTSVPAAGRYVSLRSIANVAAGGMPLAVMDSVHPDNEHLAIRAAQALRIDLAGVDMLLPDIRQSWRETGGVICEVNVGPQLGITSGPHLYGEILSRLIPGTGRIPILVILGAAPDSQLAETLAKDWASVGYQVGWSGAKGVCAVGHWLTPGRADAFASGQMLLANQGVTAIILSVNDSSTMLQGLPFDRYDVLLIAGNFLDNSPQEHTPGPAVTMTDLLGSLLPACRRKIFTLAGLDMAFPPPHKAIAAQWVIEPLREEDAPKALRAELGLAA